MDHAIERERAETIAWREVGEVTANTNHTMIEVSILVINGQ